VSPDSAGQPSSSDPAIPSSSSSLPPPSPVLIPGFEMSTGGLDEAVVLLSIDHILEFTMDALLDRGAAMEEQIKAYFHDADTNGDGTYTPRAHERRG
jgi:hypothetical protein